MPWWPWLGDCMKTTFDSIATELKKFWQHDGFEMMSLQWLVPSLIRSAQLCLFLAPSHKPSSFRIWWRNADTPYACMRISQEETSIQRQRSVQIFPVSFRKLRLVCRTATYVLHGELASCMWNDSLTDSNGGIDAHHVTLAHTLLDWSSSWSLPNMSLTTVATDADGSHDELGWVQPSVNMLCRRTDLDLVQ